MKLMKPMLAEKCPDVNSLTYPVLASPKLDGVRAMILDARLMARSLKPIPNTFLQNHFSRSLLDGLDGELIDGQPTEEGAYRGTVSTVMSVASKATATYLWVFDDFTYPNKPFTERFRSASRRVEELRKIGMRVVLVPHYMCETAEELTECEEMFLQQGYEGAMVRSLNGPYKHGRSTVKEGFLLKVKRFLDAEAEVVACQELMHNMNEQKTNELGAAHRSQEKAGKVPGGVLGALVCKDLKTGIDFSIGSAFTQEQRKELWELRGKLVGSIVKYRYFPTGSKERPRFPTFVGFRDAIDMD